MTMQAAKHMAHQARTAKGFTLIELMIAVVVVGILAAIALPNYTEYVQRTRRATAQTALQDAATYMQRFYASNNAYDRTPANQPVALPTTMQSVPYDQPANKRFYNISLLNVTPTAFTLQAVPVPGGPMVGDKCGTFTLTQTGVRGLSQNTATVADCWK